MNRSNMLNMRKSHNRDKERYKFQEKKNTFLIKCNELFDCAACQCKCSCKCPVEKKLPKIELGFLRDQRTSRKMIIGGIDRNVTSRNVKNYQSMPCVGDDMQPSTSGLQVGATQHESSSSSNTPLHSADEFVPPAAKKSRLCSKRLPALAMAADRTGTSNRSTGLMCCKISA